MFEKGEKGGSGPGGGRGSPGPGVLVPTEAWALLPPPDQSVDPAPPLGPASPGPWFPGRSQEEWEDPAAASGNLPDTYSVFVRWGLTFPSSVF